MNSLVSLYLNDCSRLTSLQDIFDSTPSLKRISLSRTPIRDMSSSFTRLGNFEFLDRIGYKNLECVGGSEERKWLRVMD